MALQDNTASDPAVIAPFVSPYNRYTGLLEDFEEGGIDLNDGTQGLDVQIWYLSYDDDDDSPTYGDFTLRAETTGEVYVVLNVPAVSRVGLAFNQNMDVFIAYETRDCGAFYYWWDPNLADYTTTALPANSKHVACCLDDHRPTQTGTSDIILGYIRNGELYYRQERERYLTERSLGSVGAAILDKVGMTTNLRVKFDVFAGLGVRLSHVVGHLCGLVGVTGDMIDVTALHEIFVRGYISAGAYTVADTIRGLQRDFFFDFPEIDGKLVAVFRGGPVVATITQNDCVAGAEFDFETSREQGVEFPVKLHLAYTSDGSDYRPTKETSERRSRDIKSQSEVTLQSAVNWLPDDAAARADVLHKITWNEFEGRAKFTLPEKFAWLAPSNVINFEARPGTFKRVRILSMINVDGTYECEAVVDRASAVNSILGGIVTGTTPVPPELPPPTITGDTTWEFMNLPALTTAHDDLYAYIVGHGTEGTAWHGARVQRLAGADWATFGDITTAALMGQVEEYLPASSEYFIDSTNTILVSLNGTPSTTTLDAMLAGAGAWLIGNEIIQVKDWVAEGDNWRGSTLIRGRLDTDPESHAIADRVVYLAAPHRVQVDPSLVDTLMTLRAVSFGQTPADAAQSDHDFIGASQEEWPPEMLTAAQDGNDWGLSWIPRYRLGNSANPIPSAHFYGWRIRFTVGGDTAQRDTNSIDPEFTYTEAQQVADFGSAQSSFDAVEIRGLNHLGGEGKALTEAVT